MDINFNLRFGSCTTDTNPTYTRVFDTNNFPSEVPSTQILGATHYSSCDNAYFKLGQITGDGK